MEIQKAFTKVPNAIMEAMTKTGLSGVEFEIIICVLRYTYGYHREASKLSASYVAKSIGREERYTAAKIQSLIRRKILLEREAPTYRLPRSVMVNSEVSLWEKQRKGESGAKNRRENESALTCYGQGLRVLQTQHSEDVVKTTSRVLQIQQTGGGAITTPSKEIEENSSKKVSEMVDDSIYSIGLEGDALFEEDIRKNGNLYF